MASATAPAKEQPCAAQAGAALEAQPAPGIQGYGRHSTAAFIFFLQFVFLLLGKASLKQHGQD